MFVTVSLLSGLPVMIQRGMKLSVDKRADSVHHMTAIRSSCACQINPVCAAPASEIGTEELGATQVFQGYNVTVLTITHWEQQLLSILTAKL